MGPISERKNIIGNVLLRRVEDFLAATLEDENSI